MRLLNLFAYRFLIYFFLLIKLSNAKCFDCRPPDGAQVLKFGINYKPDKTKLVWRACVCVWKNVVQLSKANLPVGKLVRWKEEEQIVYWIL